MHFQAKYILKNNYYHIFNNEKSTKESWSYSFFFGEEQSIKILISHIKPNPTRKWTPNRYILPQDTFWAT